MGDAMPRRKERPTITISIQVTHNDYARLRAAGQRVHLALATFVRQAALEKIGGTYQPPVPGGFIYPPSTPTT